MSSSAMSEELLNAAIEGSLPQIQRLITRDNLQSTDRLRLTVLHWVSRLGHTSLVDYLLKQGAQVEAQDRDGLSPLMYAARNGKTGAVRMLLEKGANPALTNKQGETALDQARSKGHADVVEILLGNKDSIPLEQPEKVEENQVDPQGLTHHSPVNNKSDNSSHEAIDQNQHLDVNKAASLEKTLSQLKLDRNNRIGAGNFGQVYKGTLDGTEVAVKELVLPVKGRAKIPTSVVNEIRVSAKIRHPSVVLFIGYILDQQFNCILLLYELINGHNLDQIIYDDDRAKEYCCNLTKRYNVLLRIAEALAFLHSQNPPIVHGDVKPANMMLSRNGSVKLCDLGLSKFKYRSCISSSVGGGRGTPIYMAPEQLLYQKSSSTASDVYSFGASAFEVVFEEYLWDIGEVSDSDADEETDECTILKNVMESQKISDNLKGRHSHPVYSMIEQCVQFEHGNRPSASYVVDKLKVLAEAKQ